jgi:hypothetical protein
MGENESHVNCIMSIKQQIELNFNHFTIFKALGVVTGLISEGLQFKKLAKVIACVFCCEE